MDAAKDGDTIIVYSGTYTENVDVNKELKIISKSGTPEDTVVQPLKEYAYAFNVTANNVTISGFRLVGSNDNGIYLDGVQHNNISNNEFSGCKIDLSYSDNNTVSNNSVSTSWEPHLYYSDNNLLINNIFSGFETGFSMSYSDNNILKGNNIGGSDQGLIIISSSNNTFDNNSIHGGWVGIYFYPPSNNNKVVNNHVNSHEGSIVIFSSYNNLIYNNYFDSEVFFNAGDDGNNTWNITKTPGTNIIGGPFLGGNYWSDYVGNDTNGDGLGDTLLPYNSDGGIENGGDYLPLVKQAEPPEPAAIYIVNNGTGPTADFTSIQAAVDAAKDGDTILVYSGIYTENVVVNKELTIISESGNPEDTVVQAFDRDGDTFDVTANNVTINGFKVENGDPGIHLDGVQNSNISNNRLFANSVGIVINSSSNNILHNNSCSHMRDGIYIYYSNNNFLSNNSFSAMEFCFFMRHSNNNILIGNSIHSEHPLWLRYSCNNTMSDNSISGGWEGIDLLYSSNNTMNNNSMGGGDVGIGVSHSNNTTMNNNYVSGAQGIIIGSSSYCILSNNTVSAQDLNGFSLSNSNNNILKDNIVVEDEHYSARCSFYLGSSNNNILTGNIARQTILDEGCWNINLINSSSNLIYDNYFNSTKNVYDNGNNTWNITKTPGTNIIGGPFLGGNYWSDYAGADTDGDGLGDTLLPYDSEGQIASGGDYLPLVKPAEPPEPAAIYIVNNGAG